MSAIRKAFNPFYVLLVIVGVAFTVTACAYGVMTVRDMRATEPTPPDAPGEPLMALLRERGGTVLMVQIAVLAVASIGAMATDDYWRRRDAAASETAAAAPRAPAAPSPTLPRKDAP